MPLFKLPTDLAQLILNDWIHDATSIASLDSACGMTERDEFLKMVRHSQFMLARQPYFAKNCPDFVRWLLARGI